MTPILINLRRQIDEVLENTQCKINTTLSELRKHIDINDSNAHLLDLFAAPLADIEDARSNIEVRIELTPEQPQAELDIDLFRRVMGKIGFRSRVSGRKFTSRECEEVLVKVFRATQHQRDCYKTAAKKTLQELHSQSDWYVNRHIETVDSQETPVNQPDKVV